MLLFLMPNPPVPDLYIATMGNKASLKASEICALLRAEGFSAETDICGRGLKAQMKYADKIGARFSCVLGDDEISSGKAKLKDMAEGTETVIEIDKFIDELGEARRQQIFKEIAEVM